MRLIDADAMKAHIIEYACDPCKKYGADRDGIRCPFCNTGNLLGEIDEAPTVDVPERNVGKWVEEIGMLMCSECGDAWGTEQFDEVMSFNYCPNCGARMRERSEDE